MQTSSNSIKRHTPLLRGLIVLAGASVLGPWLWNVSADAGHAAVRGVPVRPDEALTAIVASAALVAVGWLALGVLLELLSLVPGAVGRGADRVSDVVTPGLVRHAVGALLGVGLVAGLAPGASVAAPATAVHAASDPLPDPGFAPLPGPGIAPLTDPGFAPLPEPERAPAADEPTASPRGWTPDAPVVRAQPDLRVLSPAPRRGTSHDAPAEVVVQRGDTLWSIAARHLGPDASDAEIARAWPAWFEVNRGVVGDDPDLLRPGQLLRAPEGVVS